MKFPEHHKTITSVLACGDRQSGSNKKFAEIFQKDEL
jgi:hypothetical protein